MTGRPWSASLAAMALNGTLASRGIRLQTLSHARERTRATPARSRANGELRRDRSASRAGPEHLGRELAADDLLRVGGGLDHRVQVDPGRDAHVLDHVHEFLGGDVAGGAGRVRAPAEPADGRVEVLYP